MNHEIPPPDPGTMRRAQRQARASWRANGSNTLSHLAVVAGFLLVAVVVARKE